MLLVVLRVCIGVVTLRLARRAHVFCVGKAPQRGRRLVASGCRVVLHRPAFDPAVHIDPVAVDQAMSLVRVRKAVEEPLFGRQAGQKRQIGFSSLHAVLARQVRVGRDLFVVRDAVRLDDLLEDLGHGLLLEDAPVGAQLRARQCRFHHGAVACPSEAGVALLEAGDHAMDVSHGHIPAPDREQRRLIQHRAKVHRRIEARQLHAQKEGLGQGFIEREFEHLEVHACGGRGERKTHIG
ncbi:hypothetical protein D3C86_240050 [compost metagenome]